MIDVEARYLRRVCELREIPRDPRNGQQQHCSWMRCGRKLTVGYTGVRRHISRYGCSGT